MQSSPSTPPALTTPLADLLGEARSEIVRRWTEQMRRKLGERLPQSVLVDSLPDFLDDLASALRAPHPDPAPAPKPRIRA